MVDAMPCQFLEQHLVNPVKNISTELHTPNRLLLVQPASESLDSLLPSFAKFEVVVSAL